MRIPLLAAAALFLALPALAGATDWPDDPPASCPTDLSAVANGDGSVTLTFTPAPWADNTTVLRAQAGGDFEVLATIPPGLLGYTDTTTETGAAYTYQVAALFGSASSGPCPTVEVTTIPDFPTALAASLAAACGVGAYIAVRRRS